MNIRYTMEAAPDTGLFATFLAVMPKASPRSLESVLKNTHLPRTRAFVLGMASHDGTINAADVYALADTAKMSAQQVRLCFRRLVAEGLFEQHGRGRKATFVATTRGHAMIHPDMRVLGLAYLQDAGLAPWDGKWRLVGFGFAESDRPARDAMRERLTLLGGACLQNGLYISPHPWESGVERMAEELGVGHVITQFVAKELKLGKDETPLSIASGLWPIAEVSAAYAKFVEGYSPMIDEQVTAKANQDDILLVSLSMAADFGSCIRLDPLLPPELLPADWPGSEARELLRRGRELVLEKSPLMREAALFQTFDRVIPPRKRP